MSNLIDVELDFCSIEIDKDQRVVRITKDSDFDTGGHKEISLSFEFIEDLLSLAFDKDSDHFKVLQSFKKNKLIWLKYTILRRVICRKDNIYDLDELFDICNSLQGKTINELLDIHKEKVGY